MDLSKLIANFLVNYSSMPNDFAAIIIIAAIGVAAITIAATAAVGCASHSVSVAGQ